MSSDAKTTNDGSGTYGIHGDIANARDRLANFHGNQVVYVHWAKHLSFSAPMAFPLPPQMPFAALVSDILKPFYGMHPDYAKIDWSTVEWTVDGRRFTPTMDLSIGENGVRHKSVVQFRTPGLDGYHGVAS